ncbi:helix-turn-helix transcriptional regulator [Catellatospora bangladeshensis]|uniref:DNA-binding response regulator n=1 Tax=Catellatospora bangladeshensis TaxID=310355 RepID=A0A8J3NFD3_9ACTN|nr:response regulator transcription factor [Catellatospora bangladeshensis]GIF79287.1 DNA-binding response regulator [Catellatospora bangladeshensis]
MQTVLVCVRTAAAAATIASCAERLGVAAGVRTATSAAEAIAQLAAFPAGIVLADTALTRPDTVGFTRKVMAAVPHTVLLLFGPEEPATAQAAIRAGARGLIGGTEPDPVSTAAKALLLVSRPAARTADAARPAVAGVMAGATRAPAGPGRPMPPAGPGMSVPYANRPAAAMPSAVVPVQRGDQAGEAPPVRPARSVTLTERELQVLRGMADGQSNAEIGRDLFVSEDTVKTHARRLFRKLGARDRAHAVAAGFRAGLVF